MYVLTMYRGLHSVQQTSIHLPSLLVEILDLRQSLLVGKAVDLTCSGESLLGHNGPVLIGYLEG